MTKYVVRIEGTIEVEANSEEEAKQIATEKRTGEWDWASPEIDD